MDKKEQEADIGKRISACRSQRGLSQATVARRAGIDPSYLSRIETGRVHPTVRMATRISTALRVPMEDLLGQSPPDRKHQPCPVTRSGRCLMDLLDTGAGGPSLDPEAYTPRQIKLLRRFTTVLQKSSPNLQRALEVLFSEILDEDSSGGN